MNEEEPPAEERSALRPPGPVPAAGLGRSSADTPEFHQEEPQQRPPSAPVSPCSPVPHPLTSRPGRPPADPGPVLAPPRASRVGALVTVAVVLVVVGGVAVGTVLGGQADSRLAAAPRPRQSTAADPSAPSTAARSPSGAGSSPTGASPAGADADDQIEFSSGHGAGRLLLLDHAWTRPSSPTAPTRLRIRLELVCTDGAVEYDPAYFSLFDADGHLVAPAPGRAGAHPLGSGRLRAGEQVRGSLAFDLPRGAVTLVMGDGTRSVTALRLPG